MEAKIKSLENDNSVGSAGCRFELICFNWLTIFYYDFRDEISKLKSEYEAEISDLEDDIKLLQQTVSAKDKAIEAYKAMAANSATNFGSQVIYYYLIQYFNNFYSSLIMIDVCLLDFNLLTLKFTLKSKKYSAKIKKISRTIKQKMNLRLLNEHIQPSRK